MLPAKWIEGVMKTFAEKLSPTQEKGRTKDRKLTALYNHAPLFLRDFSNNEKKLKRGGKQMSWQKKLKVEKTRAEIGVWNKRLVVERGNTQEKRREIQPWLLEQIFFAELTAK